MALYVKKPIEIEAYKTDKEMIIHTLEGDMKANIGDYIITGIKGEQYPCKPDIFEATYEMSTADVVPKSEYDEVLSSWQKIHNSYDADCIEHYKYGRAEVARKIFEEIEAECKWYMDAYKYSSLGESIMRNIIKSITELKKKYAEGDE